MGRSMGGFPAWPSLLDHVPQVVGSTKRPGHVCPCSLRLQPERLKGWSMIPTTTTKSSSHSHGELTRAWELLSPGENHNKTLKTKINRRRGHASCLHRASPSSPGLSQAGTTAEGFSAAHGPGCPSPAHPPSSPKCQEPSPRRADTRCAGTGLHRNRPLPKSFARLLSPDGDWLGAKQTGSRQPSPPAFAHQKDQSRIRMLRGQEQRSP